jgi:DNA-binding transcriptional MerR regulator
MRISELADRSGVPVPTIKYYLREGLLPPGEATSATQARYGEAHLARLRLVRVLRDVGHVPVANLGAVLDAIDDRALDLHDKIGAAHHALGPEPPADPPSEHTAARAEVVRFVDERGWRVRADCPSLDGLAAVLVGLRALHGDAVDAGVFLVHAGVAEELARFELATIDTGAGVEAAITQVVVGTVLFEQAFVALRRLAQEHHSAERFAGRRPTGVDDGGR